MWGDQPEQKSSEVSKEANGENGVVVVVEAMGTGTRAEGAQLVGIVKRYSTKNGYGFITVEDGGPDCFVHQSEIVVDGFRCLEEGARVQFRHVTRKDKPTATQVRPLPGSRFKVYKSRADAQTKSVQANDLGNVFGYVKWFDMQKGFGFIVLDGTPKEAKSKSSHEGGANSPSRASNDVFVHIKEVASQLPLQEGQRVAFELTEETGGKYKAFNVCAVPGQVQYYPGVEPFYQQPPPFTGTGVVRFFNADKGFGFLTPSDNSADVYFNRSAVISGEMVKEGDVLGYELSGNGFKVWATNVVILEMGEPGVPETYDYGPVVYPYPYGELSPSSIAYDPGTLPYDPNIIYYQPS